MNPPIRHVQHIGPEGASLIHGAEGCVLVAYLDTGGVWTIGWGTTVYPDGQRVRQGDVCTRESADAYFAHDIAGVERSVDRLTVDTLLLRQFEALCSLVYNIGEPQFSNSTLRRFVNANPHEPSIRAQFMRWHYDNGKPIEGLWNRRHQEADHYFGVHTPKPPFPHYTPTLRAA